MNDGTGSLRHLLRNAFLTLVVFSAAGQGVPQSTGLEETLLRTFPAVRGILRARSEFRQVQIDTGAGRVSGLRAEPLGATADSLAPEEEALSAVFPLRYDGDSVIAWKNLRVRSRPASARTAPAREEGGKLVYSSVHAETDALVFASSDFTEELLLLRSRDAPTRFEYELDVVSGGAAGITLASGEVHVTGPDGEGLVLLAPVVVDAVGRRSASAARWELGPTEGNGSRNLILHLDPAGLTYPLLIDPSWTTTGSLTTGRGNATAILLQTGKVLILAGAPTSQATAELYDPATGIWSPTADLTLGRAWHTATLLRDGRVLVAGGFITGGNSTADCQLYDPATGTWSPAGSLQQARQRHTATLLQDGRVLVAGGESPINTGVASAEIYDPSTDTWSTVTPMNSARSRHTASLLPDGRVLVAAGRSGGGTIFALAEIYDPGTGSWSSTGTLATSRHEHAATLLPDGRVLVAGGDRFGAATEEIFDPALGSWSPAGSLTTRREQHTATLLPSGKVLVAGGVGPSSVLATTEIFDPATVSWTAGPSLNEARAGHTATLLPSGKILVASGGSLATAEVFDGDVGSWSPASSLTQAREKHTATPLKDGTVLVAGGNNAELSAEIYDPGPGTWTATGSLNVSRDRHTATLLGDGRVLVAGSVTSPLDGETAELFDGSSWSRTAGNLITNRYSHTATLLPCGEVLVAGGESSSGVVLASAERFHPASEQWVATGDMKTGRWSHTATLLPDGTVLVTGGWNGAPLASAELYDPATGTWTETGFLSTGRYRHTATLLPDGTVLIAGGWNGSSLASAEIYDPASGMFSPAPDMGTPRDTHAAVALANGKVLVTGGFTPTRTASAELYDPETRTWTPAADMSIPRDDHTMTLLTTGQVLLAAGSTPFFDETSELYDVGRGEQSAWRPQLATVTNPLVEGGTLSAAGTGFQGISEASTGNAARHSATNYPLVRLQRLDNEATRWISVHPGGSWSDTDFLSTALTDLVPGPSTVTVFTNGVPGASRVISVECIAPAITTDPAPRTVCTGDTVVFSTAATGECLAGQWRKDGVSLVEGAPFTGTLTDTLTVSPATAAEAGDYDVVISSACSSTSALSASATLTVNENLSASTVSVSGATSVCSSCTGGTATESHAGGGAVTYQWGYRTTSGGSVTDIAGENAGSYVVNGAHFPGPGTYFLVLRTTPTCGSPLISNEVTIDVTDAPPVDAAQFFTITSRDRENVLEWMNPSGFGSVSIHVISGSTSCTFPADPLNAATLLVDQTGPVGGHDLFVHSGLTNDRRYCYTVFVDQGGGVYSDGRSNRGRPFDTSGNVKWAYHVGTTAMAPPGSGIGVVHAVANDNAIHSMVKGAGGGTWPAMWTPRAMNGPSQGRPTTIPVTVGTASRVIFLGSQDGQAYAFDAETGAPAWVSSPLGSMIQAAPSGWFSFVQPPFDYILIGTRDSSVDNVFHALDVSSGTSVWQYNGEVGDRIGIITGQAAVDYTRQRVYFTSFERSPGTSTVWSLMLDGTRDWSTAVGSVVTGAVFRGGTLYVGSTDGNVHALDVVSGAVNWSWPTGDGAPKGFIMPDRFTDDLYLASTTTVSRLSDDGAPPTVDWSRSDISSPSTPIYLPGGAYVYLGSGDGSVYQLDAANGATVTTFPLGDGSAGVGSPTIDVVNRFLYVGTEAGIIYAVQLP